MLATLAPLKFNYFAHNNETVYLKNQAHVFSVVAFCDASNGQSVQLNGCMGVRVYFGVCLCESTNGIANDAQILLCIGWEAFALPDALCRRNRACWEKPTQTYTQRHKKFTKSHDFHIGNISKEVDDQHFIDTGSLHTCIQPQCTAHD